MNKDCLWIYSQKEESWNFFLQTIYGFKRILKTIFGCRVTGRTTFSGVYIYNTKYSFWMAKSVEEFRDDFKK